MATPSTHNAMAAADPSPVPLRGTGDAGAALVELAIALPLLVMLVFGVYAVSQAYNAKTELTGAVREGARSVALRQKSVAPNMLTAEQQTVKQAATLAIKNSSPGLTPDPTVTVTDDCLSTTTSPSAPGNDAVVEVSWQMRFSIPFVAEGTKTITAKGVMRCGL